MRNEHFEARRRRKWKPITTRPVTVTRAILIRAFSTPDRPRTEVATIVSQYLGSSPVPPSWGRPGIRGIFGRKIERLWSRHIKGLRLATYREAGRYLTPVVQTAYDFGTTPEELQKMAEASKEADGAGNVGSMILSDLKAMVQTTHSAGDKTPTTVPIFMDEWSCYATLPAATPMRSTP